MTSVRPFMQLLTAQRRLLGLLALIPFLALALISPGTMLARDGQGGVTVVLCVEGGPVALVMGADGQLTEKAPHDGDRVCHWAPHTQQLLGVASVDLTEPALTLLPPAFAVAQPEYLRRADVLAPSARGPPAFV